ncbi:TPA: hypothetical protein G8W61_004495 [Salmonella enterica]|uniref:Uncharacterized protein n=1 Tax=Salmonella enterica TaxID=28901 RepID=A0A760BHI1_SALER|nr:hypothetical protein [Salmonella enterica]HAG2284128.1 hypothetical protein [Salmonella enterica]
MGIYIKSPPPVPKLPEIDPSQISGRFGAMTSGPLKGVTDFNAALVGFMRSTKVVPHIPDPSWPWGGLWTVSSEGAGADGKRCLTLPLRDDEIVLQFFYSTASTLYSRVGSGNGGFTPWQKRWG